MALSPADREVIDAMKERALHLKRREIATDAIEHELSRYRMLVSVLVAAVFALLVVVAVYVVARLDPAPTRWRLAIPALALGTFAGVLLGQAIWHTDRGKRMLADAEHRLLLKYAGDLHSGRRWGRFYYRDEDISPYVPQILYCIEAERRFDSVDDALAYARSNRRHSELLAERVRRSFERVVAQTSAVVISTTDEEGQPSSRIMRFVKSDRPGIWYVTTSPHASRVHDLDRGRIALVTVPTGVGAVVSSNRVRIERAGVPFSAIADLYRDQAPGYVEGMSSLEQEQELVYELRLLSARVETWQEYDVVVFDHPEVSGR